MNTLKVIKNDQDYQAALARLDALMDATSGSPEAEELDLMSYLVDKYETEVFPVELPDPVEAIKFRMEQQGLTRKDLIPFIGSQSKVSEVLNHKRPLSLSMIRALHEGLGIPWEVLLKEHGKQLEERRFNPEEYPLKEMHAKGYFPGVESLKKVREQSEELLEKLFSSLYALPGQMVYCRNTNFTSDLGATGLEVANGHAVYTVSGNERSRENEKDEKKKRDMNEKALFAWQARVLQICETQDLPKYSNKIITEEFIRNLAHLSVFSNGPMLALQVLWDNGIHFVILPHLSQTYLDGACFKSPSGRPVIGMTLRHDRLDNFWFTLVHELSHALLHLQKDNPAFFDDTEHGLRHACNKQEVEANQFSMNLLIPNEIWEEEKETLAASNDTHELIALAQELGISPAIVAGRLRWESGNYALFNDLVGSGAVKKLFPEFISQRK